MKRGDLVALGRQAEEWGQWLTHFGQFARVVPTLERRAEEAKARHEAAQSAVIECEQRMVTMEIEVKRCQQDGLRVAREVEAAAAVRAEEILRAAEGRVAALEQAAAGRLNKATEAALQQEARLAELHAEAKLLQDTITGLRQSAQRMLEHAGAVAR